MAYSNPIIDILQKGGSTANQGMSIASSMMQGAINAMNNSSELLTKYQTLLNNEKARKFSETMQLQKSVADQAAAAIAARVSESRIALNYAQAAAARSKAALENKKYKSDLELKNKKIKMAQEYINGLSGGSGSAGITETTNISENTPIGNPFDIGAGIQQAAAPDTLLGAITDQPVIQPPTTDKSASEQADPLIDPLIEAAGNPQEGEDIVEASLQQMDTSNMANPFEWARHITEGKNPEVYDRLPDIPLPPHIKNRWGLNDLAYDEKALADQIKDPGAYGLNSPNFYRDTDVQKNNMMDTLMNTFKPAMANQISKDEQTRIQDAWKTRYKLYDDGISIGEKSLYAKKSQELADLEQQHNALIKRAAADKAMSKLTGVPVDSGAAAEAKRIGKRISSLDKDISSFEDKIAKNIGKKPKWLTTDGIANTAKAFNAGSKTAAMYATKYKQAAGHEPFKKYGDQSYPSPGFISFVSNNGLRKRNPFVVMENAYSSVPESERTNIVREMLRYSSDVFKKGGTEAMEAAKSISRFAPNMSSKTLEATLDRVDAPPAIKMTTKNIHEAWKSSDEGYQKKYDKTMDDAYDWYTMALDRDDEMSKEDFKTRFAEDIRREEKENGISPTLIGLDAIETLSVKGLTDFITRASIKPLQVGTNFPDVAEVMSNPRIINIFDDNIPELKKIFPTLGTGKPPSNTIERQNLEKTYDSFMASLTGALAPSVYGGSSARKNKLTFPVKTYDRFGREKIEMVTLDKKRAKEIYAADFLTRQLNNRQENAGFAASGIGGKPQ